MILNNRKKMRLGYLVMRNTGYADMGLSWDEAREAEDNFFAGDSYWLSVPKTNKGRIGVKTFLGNLLYAHIKKELPLLKREIINKHDYLQRELDGMGVQIAKSHEARAKFTELTMQLQSSLSDVLIGAYSQEYMDKFKDDVDGGDDDQRPESLHFIRSTLQKLYLDYSETMALHNCQRLKTSDIVAMVTCFRGNELPGFVPFTVFTKLFSRTLTT